MGAGRHATASTGPAGSWLALALAAFTAIGVAFFALATLADREATLSQGRTAAENTAALLAEQADRALRVAELTAMRVGELVALHGAAALGAEQWEALQALDLETPEVGAIWVLDGQGRRVASSTKRNLDPRDFSDRPEFQALSAGQPRHLSALARSGSTGQLFFGLSHAVRADDRLLGAVHAAIWAEEFGRIAERLALGPGAELRLIRRDGAVLLAWPPPGAVPLAPQAPRWAEEGLAEETGPDGMARLVAWRATPGMPVIAEAALSRDHVLAPFQRRLVRNATVFALSLLLAGGLVLAALRATRRELAARHAMEERGAALAEALAERGQLLASVQEGEARLRLAQEAGGLGLWDLDLHGRRVALIGEAFIRWGLPVAHGRALRPVPVRTVLRAIHPEDRPAVVLALATALREGEPLAAEFRLADQPERWIGVRAEPREGADGQPGRLLGIALDVTAARRAQRALEEERAGLERRVQERTGALAQANARLREGEARFRGLFNATFQFIGLLSPDGTVLEANAAMLRLGGVRAAEVIGRPYCEAPWWPEEPGTQALLRNAIAEGASGRFVRRETGMRDTKGARVAVDFSVTPVRDEDGIVSLLVAEARDVSALKAAQALLHEAQKMDTLGQLTGGVAHDFNNLLMAVLGNLAILRKRAEQRAPDLLRPIDNAAQAAERGATLTQRLLAFARRQDLKPTAVELRGLLLGIEALLRRSAGPMVVLEMEAPAGLPPAHVDPHALELALVNLAVNARDAMPAGGRLSVRLAAVDGPAPRRLPAGRWLTIAVADTGEGMDAGTLGRAVEPFFTTKAPGQGTGLGLSMVDGVAAQSGGTLVLESTPGRGTTATIWLPVSAILPAPPQRAEQAPAPAPAGRGAVLVVDDEALVLESTSAMLEELGYEPVPAESGEAALGLLLARGDLVAVLTDHAMPGMTGLTLAERVRALRPGLPVLLATGHAGAWADDPDAPPRLMKPYGLGQLAAALRSVLAEVTG